MNIDELERLCRKSKELCPWARQTDSAGFAEELKKEVNELSAAIAADDVENQKEELGDVMLDWMHACIASDIGPEQAIDSAIEKLQRRKPFLLENRHVDMEEAKALWKNAKEQEKMAEYLWQIDENDNPVAKVTRQEMRNKRLPHRSVAVFVFNSKGEILVMRRSHNKDKAPGKMEINVAGIVTYGESYQESAKRELFEEIGADSELVHLFKIWVKNSLIMCYKVIYDGPLKLQESELDDAYFVPFCSLILDVSFRGTSFALLEKLKETENG
jgi:isopentenyldiphosphate isomerase/NTP pyrophosphatase (non-canonical NTP hydrolase)